MVNPKVAEATWPELFQDPNGPWCLPRAECHARGLCRHGVDGRARRGDGASGADISPRRSPRPGVPALGEEQVDVSLPRRIENVTDVAGETG